MLCSTSLAITNVDAPNDAENFFVPSIFGRHQPQVHHHGLAMSTDLAHERQTHQYNWDASACEQNAYLPSNRLAPGEYLQPHHGVQYQYAGPANSPSPPFQIPPTNKQQTTRNPHGVYHSWDATAPTLQPHGKTIAPAFSPWSHQPSDSADEVHQNLLQCNNTPPLHSRAGTSGNATVTGTPSASAMAKKIDDYERPWKNRHILEVYSPKRKAVPASAASLRAVDERHDYDFNLHADIAAVPLTNAKEVPLSRRPPVNLSAVIKENMPPWCSTALDWKESGVRLRLSIMAVSWFLVHEHGYDAVFDRNGKIWVRKGRPVVIPLGGQRVNFGFVRPPPKTYWAESICLSVCDIAKSSSFPATCPEAIGCIAAYEGTPVDQVKHAMLPVGLFNSFAEDAASGSGRKVVNGWVVFRTWFMDYIRDWNLLQKDVSRLARAAYSTQTEKPYWKNIGRTWTYFRDHCTFLQEKHSFDSFISLELKKYKMSLTPMDILRQSGIPEATLRQLIDTKKAPKQDFFKTKRPRKRTAPKLGSAAKRLRRASSQPRQSDETEDPADFHDPTSPVTARRRCTVSVAGIKTTSNADTPAVQSLVTERSRTADYRFTPSPSRSLSSSVGLSGERKDGDRTRACGVIP